MLEGYPVRSWKSFFDTSQFGIVCRNRIQCCMCSDMCIFIIAPPNSEDRVKSNMEYYYSNYVLILFCCVIISMLSGSSVVSGLCK